MLFRSGRTIVRKSSHVLSLGIYVLYCGCLHTIYVCTLAIIGMVENGSGVWIYPADFPSTPAPPKVPVLARYSVPMLYIGPKLDVLSPRTDLTAGNFRRRGAGMA